MGTTFQQEEKRINHAFDALNCAALHLENTGDFESEQLDDAHRAVERAIQLLKIVKRENEVAA
jgi:hypothetical protein